MRRLAGLLAAIAVLIGSVSVSHAQQAYQYFPESIAPTVDAAYDLGNSQFRWRNVYITGSITLASLPATVLGPGTFTGTYTLGGTVTLNDPAIVGGMTVLRSGAPTPYTAGNDIVLQSLLRTTVAPTGPQQVGMVTLRIRPSARPGFCNVVMIAGNSYGESQEFPLAFLNPAYGFLVMPGTSQATSGPIYTGYTIDLPAGTMGCSAS